MALLSADEEGDPRYSHGLVHTSGATNGFQALAVLEERFTLNTSRYDALGTCTRAGMIRRCAEPSGTAAMPGPIVATVCSSACAQQGGRPERHACGPPQGFAKADEDEDIAVKMMYCDSRKVERAVRKELAAMMKLGGRDGCLGCIGAYVSLPGSMKGLCYMLPMPCVCCECA